MRSTACYYAAQVSSAGKFVWAMGTSASHLCSSFDADRLEHFGYRVLLHELRIVPLKLGLCAWYHATGGTENNAHSTVDAAPPAESILTGVSSGFSWDGYRILASGAKMHFEQRFTPLEPHKQTPLTPVNEQTWFNPELD